MEGSAIRDCTGTPDVAEFVIGRAFARSGGSSGLRFRKPQPIVPAFRRDDDA
jgi:hypothetical protein